MNPPAEKTVPKLSGELGRYAIPNYIIKTYDGKLIDDGIGECECCGIKTPPKAWNVEEDFLYRHTP